MGVTTNELKNQMKQQQAAPAPAPQQKPGASIAQYLGKNMKAMASVLPKHMTPERMARIALSEIRKNPQLLECSVESLGASVMQAATLGLEPTTLGHCYFVPFWNGKEKRRDVQFIIGYKGYIDLAHRTGDLKTIKAFAVHENDHFTYKYGINEELEHIPADKNRGAVIKYYAYALLKDGGSSFVVMSREAVLEHAFTHSKQVKEGQLTGVWRNHFDSMAKKTVIKELIKYMPMSIEYQEKMNADEKVIKDVTPGEDKDSIFDMEFAVIEEQPEGAPEAPAQEEGPDPEPQELTDDEIAIIQAKALQREIDEKKKANK